MYAWLEFPHVSEKFWDDHPEWREKMKGGIVAFDLAVTRFSGRSAPLHPGGAPGLPDGVTDLKPPVVQELTDSLVERRWIGALDWDDVYSWEP